MITVTKTYLPSFTQYTKYLKRIWKSRQVANNGDYVKLLEKKLEKYLGIKHVLLVTNGTLGLQISIRALGLAGEIITTPFTYIATAASIIWENCIPKFVDIEPKTFCIDADKIEQSITNKTTAILAVHVYGNPCNVEKIQKIAKKYNLKVIYDAAHAFGVEYKNKSIASFGDLSVFSFHATKILHTVEGGAIATNSDEIAHKISYMRNFGHKTPEEFWDIGINAKMSELHAAMGLALLSHVKQSISKRKILANLYDQLLENSKLKVLSKPQYTESNFMYYPVVFEKEKQLLNVQKKLNQDNIFPRRYFCPSLNTVEYIKNISNSSCSVSESVAVRVLCLPLYPELRVKDVKKIANIITSNL